MRPERGRQLVHVRHVVLDGCNLILELLQRSDGGWGSGQMVVEVVEVGVQAGC